MTPSPHCGHTSSLLRGHEVIISFPRVISHGQALFILTQDVSYVRAVAVDLNLTAFIHIISQHFDPNGIFGQPSVSRSLLFP